MHWQGCFHSFASKISGSLVFGLIFVEPYKKPNTRALKNNNNMDLVSRIVVVTSEIQEISDAFANVHHPLIRRGKAYIKLSGRSFEQFHNENTLIKFMLIIFFFK